MSVCAGVSEQSTVTRITEAADDDDDDDDDDDTSSRTFRWNILRELLWCSSPAAVSTLCHLQALCKIKTSRLEVEVDVEHLVETIRHNFAPDKRLGPAASSVASRASMG